MEWMKVFNEAFELEGVASRDDVHRLGKWHETFHCWLMDEDFIYIQQRSAEKEDYPSLFDITVAGHLMADETVIDGVREIEEEIGISVAFSQLEFVGTLRDVIKVKDFLDYEFAHVYLYRSTFQASDFVLQEEEVASIHKMAIHDFVDLCLGNKEKVSCCSLTNRALQQICLADFVPHEQAYFQKIGAYLQK